MSEHENWAREVLADPRTAVLDTETTGLHGYACEISVYDGKAFLLDTLVNPEAPIEPGTQRIHGLTAEKLADAPALGKVWPALDGILASRRISGGNAEFDSGVIHRERARPQMSRPPLPGAAPARHSCGWHAGRPETG